MAVGEAPTRARNATLWFAIALAAVTYIDRICIARAMPLISKDLGLSNIQIAWVLGVFAWAYAVFEIPGGWLGDRIGPRRVLMRIVLWWSFFTAATGWAWSYAALFVTRLLFGAGEAGAYPNLTRVFTIWMPKKERERAQATLWLASRWSGAFTPLLVVTVLQFVTWRRAFEIFGVLGVIWAIAFYRWFRDNPADHPSVNKAELALLPPVSETATANGATPWGLFVTSPAVWLLCLQYMCLAYGWFFYVTWLPTYLGSTKSVGAGLNVFVAALLTGLPLLLGGFGCMISAALTKPLTNALGSVKLARRVLAVFGFLGASVSIVVFTRIQDPMLAMFVLGLAGFCNDFAMPPAWAGCMDVGGRYSGTISGAMNTFGSVAGAISTTFVGYLLTWTSDNWTYTFYISAAIYSLGAIFWLFLDAETPLEKRASA